MFGFIFWGDFFCKWKAAASRCFFQNNTVEYKNRLLLKREFAYRAVEGVVNQTHTWILSGWSQSLWFFLVVPTRFHGALRRDCFPGLGSFGGPCDADAAGPSLHEFFFPTSFHFLSDGKSGGCGSCWVCWGFISSIGSLYFPVWRCFRSALTASPGNPWLSSLLTCRAASLKMTKTRKSRGRKISR